RRGIPSVRGPKPASTQPYRRSQREGGIGLPLFHLIKHHLDKRELSDTRCSPNENNVSEEISMPYERPVARAAACLAFAVFAVALPSTSTAQSTLKLGWLSSLTGPLSSAAIAENQGVQFAVDEINKAGGINGQKIELITRDTAGDPTKAVNFAKQLIFVDKV